MHGYVLVGARSKGSFILCNNKTYIQALMRTVHFSLILGKIPDNDVVLSDLKLKPGSKIMMMGTREEEIVSEKFSILTLYFTDTHVNASTTDSF